MTPIASRQLLSSRNLYLFREAYRPHPLPRRPNHCQIRQTPWFRYLDIFLSMDRKINYPPNPPLDPLISPPARSQSVRRAVIWTIVYSILIDFFTLWLPLLSRHGLYRPDGTRDLARFCNILAAEYGMPAPLVRGGWMVCYTKTVFCGVQGGWEMFRGLAIGSGVWIEEEWPDLMLSPHLSTSMTELWGKRYHQVSPSVSLLMSSRIRS